MSEVTIPLRNLDEERSLLGHLDRNLRILRMTYGVEAVSRGGQLMLKGDPEPLESAASTVNRALDAIRNDGVEAGRIAEMFGNDAADETGDGPGRADLKLRTPVRPRSENQKLYMEAIEAHPVTLGVGPAGTGKTYLAVALAVAMVKAGDFRRIVLVRPAVEAGEHLGFLPGDLEAKIMPYLQPLYDALDDLLPRGTFKRYMDEGVIEISPVAYMRGRTLNHAVIILDEAQNTTIAQMKMILTRMGEHSKVIVTGDATQIDLPGNQESGLIHAIKVLRDVEGVAIRRLHREDIVRHAVVMRIVRAYDSWSNRKRLEDHQQEKGEGGKGDGRGDKSRTDEGDGRRRRRSRR